MAMTWKCLQILIFTYCVLCDCDNSFVLKHFIEFTSTLVPKNSQKHYILPGSMKENKLSISRNKILSVSHYGLPPQTSFSLDESWEESYRHVFAIPNNLTQFQHILNWATTDFFKRKLSSHRQGQIYILWPKYTINGNEIFQSTFAHELMSTRKIDLDIEIFIVIYIGGQSFQIWEIYFIKSKKVVNQVPLTMQNLPGSLSRRYNLEGEQILGMAVYDEEMNRMITMERNGNHLSFLGGFVVDVFRDMRDHLNFTEIVVEGKAYVSETQNRMLEGIGKQILEDEADLAVILAFFLPYRARHLSFLQPLTAEKIHIFFRQPSMNSVRSIFLQPFSSNLWYGLCITWILIILCLCIIPYLQYSLLEDKWMIHDAVVWTVGTICQQGWYLSPSTLPIRIVAISGFLCSLVTLCAYSAEIISSLTVETIPINSAWNLIENKFIVMGDPNARYDELLKAKFPANKVKSLFKKIDLNKDKEAVKLVLKGHYGVIYPMDAFYSHVREIDDRDWKLCKTISSVPISETRTYSGLFVKKGCIFKEIFNYSLQMIRERGLVTRSLQHMFEEANPKCPRTRLSSYKELLTLKDLFVAFMILGGGYLTSIMSLMFEIWIGGKSKIIENTDDNNILF